MCLFVRLFILLVTTIPLLSCSSSPLGRKQLLLFPDSKMQNMGAASFAEMKTKSELVTEKSTQGYIKCITDRILVAIKEDPSSWQIEVFKDDSPNAFALPGKKMGIHTGMINLAQNQDQIAAVIGHEIGHVIAQHSNERMSQATLAQTGLSLGSITLGSGEETDKLIIGALGVGVQYGVLMPFSRTHETEADRLGQIYMAKAGFDPRQASELWVQMSKLSKNSTPEFMSSHPSSESRIKDLKSRAESYMPIFSTAKRSECKK